MKITAAEVRAINGAPDLGRCRRWSWNKRQAARSLFAVTGTIFVAWTLGKMLVMWLTNSSW